MSDIPFGDGPRREPLPPLPPLPAWFNEHPQVPLHTKHCAICRTPAVKAGRVDYQTYINSPAWKIRREYALEYYGAHCCLCNSPDGLNVHHRTYERIGNERLHDLIVLCRDCHARFHQKAA